MEALKKAIGQDQTDDKDAIDAAFNSIISNDNSYYKDQNGVERAIEFLKQHFQKSRFQRGEKAWNDFVSLKRHDDEKIEEFIIKGISKRIEFVENRKSI